MRDLPQKLCRFIFFAWLLLSSARVWAGSRTLSASDFSATQLQTNCLSVILDAQGNENTMGFSLCFDTNLLAFTSAQRGPNAGNASLTVTTNQVSKGRVGFFMSLPAGNSVPAGPAGIVDVCFRALALHGVTSTSISFCDQPIARELLDVSGTTLATAYSNANITIYGSCRYGLGTNNVLVEADGGNGSIPVTADAGCIWGAVSTNDWLVINAGGSGIGNGTVNYTVLPNPNPFARTGVVSIADQTFTISQRRVVCTYALDPATQLYERFASTGQVGVATSFGCQWTATTTNSWITLLEGTNGSSSGVLRYALAANSSFNGRTGSVLIADQRLIVSQLPNVCTYILEPPYRVHGHAAGGGTLTIKATASCNWTVLNTNNWISIPIGGSGSGTGSVTYALSGNPAGIARTGLISVANQVYTIIQLESPCTYSLDPTSRIHTAESEAAIVNVTAPAGCEWAIVNTNDWMIIKLYTNGVGNGIARYTVFANPDPRSRTGYLTIGGQTFTVFQLPAVCNYSLLQTQQLFGPGPGSGSITVFTVEQCSWSVSNANYWISLTSPTNGSGGGTINFSVAASLTTRDRTGVVAVAGQPFTVTQLGSTCTYSLSANARSHGYPATNGFVTASPGAGCAGKPWTIYNPYNWIYIPGNLTGTGAVNVSYALTANLSGMARTGTVVIADQPFTITQSGVACNYSLFPSGWTHGYLNETGQIVLTTYEGCPWSVSNNFSWISLFTPNRGNGSTAIGYLVAANTGPFRTGNLIINGQTYTINQNQANPPVFTTVPQGQNVAAGQTVTFAATASGTPPLTYQWQCNGTNIFESPTAVGVTSSILVLSNVQPARIGAYTLVAGNMRGFATSGPPAFLNVNSSPVLSAIGTRAVTKGSLLAFMASATDPDASQTLTYSLAPGAPSGASINPASGLFTWTPSSVSVPSTNVVTVRVTDNGSPALSDAESLSITVVPGFTSNLTLVATGSVWKYRDTGENLGSTWSAPSYNDGGWASGRAILGYGNGNETTVVSYGPDSSAKYITTYFRRSLTIPEPSYFSAINLRVLRDDGVVVYLNGTEVYRDNMPAGPINYLTQANSSVSGTDRTSFHVSAPIDPHLLNAGNNVIAVEMHQRNNGNSTLDFDLELTGVQNGYAPSIITPPQSQIASEGGRVTFNVTATGFVPLRYQWFFNGAAMAGATNFSVTLSNLQTLQTGGYYVMVTNSGGAVTSAVVTLTVNRTNRPPVLAFIADQMVGDGATLIFNASATDPDAPPQVLTYSLGLGAPTGAVVDAAHGVFAWTPPHAFANTTNTVTLRVTDNGDPPLSDAKTFKIFVLVPPRLAGLTRVGADQVTLSWNTIPGRAYRVQYSDDLSAASWRNLGADIIATTSTTSATDIDIIAGFQQRFYRIVLVN